MAISVSKSLWKPHVAKAVEELDAAVPGCSWGTYNGHDPNISQAADAMIPKWTLMVGIVIGNALAKIIAAVAWMRAHGGWYVIWRGRIWSMTRPAAGWLPYFDRNSANPSRSHKNHVHVSFYATAPVAAPAPKPTPKPPAPAAFTEGWVPELPWTFYLDLQKPNAVDARTKQPERSRSVWLIQKALGLSVRDGIYSTELRERVRAWQLNVLKDDARYANGILGPKQAAALFGPLVKIKAKS